MKNLIWVFLLMLFAANLQAQITATTADGRRVILLEDGTWKFDTTVVVKKKPKFKKKRKKGDSGPSNPALASISCGDICATKMDPSMGEELNSLIDPIEIKENGRTLMAINLAANKGGTVFWHINAFGEQGCKDRTPKVKVDFTDGSQMTMDISNDFICDNNTTVYLGKKLGKKDQLTQLRNKTIASVIVVKQGNSEIPGALSTEQANILQKAFNCLTGK